MAIWIRLMKALSTRFNKARSLWEKKKLKGLEIKTINKAIKMITDLFHKRYRNTIFWGEHQNYPIFRKFFVQTCYILQDIATQLEKDENNNICKTAHDKFVRELGWGDLNDSKSLCARCTLFLSEPYDLWNDAHGDFSSFISIRLSLVELLFREHEAAVSRWEEAFNRSSFQKYKTDEIVLKTKRRRETLKSAIQELNHRFRESQLGLHYHAGLIQKAQDEVTMEQIVEPFWEIARGAKWKNVENDMKEAIDHRDAGKADSQLHAMKALESTIKIMSDEKGLTTGRERGAANFIDNLTSNQMIEKWESDILKNLFKDIRNPVGHGPGNQPAPALKPHEVDYIIETTMSWIRSLIRRL